MKLTPDVLAAVDQWLAGAHDELNGPLELMRETMDGPDTEAHLAMAVASLAAEAVANPIICKGLASAHILALRELVVLQQKLESGHRP